MSLRARLLIAVGAVALIALVGRRHRHLLVAALLPRTTASTSRSTTPTTPIEQAVERRRGPQPRASRVGGIAPGSYVAAARRRRHGSSSRSTTSERPARVTPARRRRPSRCRPARPPASRRCEPHRTSRSAPPSGGPRSSGCELAARRRRVLIVGAAARRHASRRCRRLLAIELASPPPRCSAPSPLGWWLVGVGLRPLRRRRGAPPRAIAGGDLDRARPRRATDRPRSAGSPRR